MKISSACKRGLQLFYYVINYQLAKGLFHSARCAFLKAPRVTLIGGIAYT
jgi:hypothetical protein